MRTHRRPLLPLAPLLRAYAEAAPPIADLSDTRAAAIRSADWLRDDRLDSLDADEFRSALVHFYDAVVKPPLHTATLNRRAGLVRHGLAHLLRSPDPLPVKFGRCVADDGPYFVPGVGPAFWSAAAQVLDPLRHPAWTPDTLAGLRRLGLLSDRRHEPAEVYGGLLGVYRRMLAREPGLTALHLDQFLALVANSRGRDLWSGVDPPDPIPALVRQERSQMPLRRWLKERGKELADARAQLMTGLKSNDGERVADALQVADAAKRRPIDWELHGPTLLPRIDRLFHADEPFSELVGFDRQAQLCGGGRWLAAAVLHLWSPHEFPPWDENAHAGLAEIDDALGEEYPAYAEAVAAVCERYRLHPLEAPAVLAECADVVSPQRKQGNESLACAAGSQAMVFGGFCPDTFRFLAELHEHNDRTWMERQRHRYRFAVREPFAELCRALAERYVEPVLRSAHGWDLETAAKSGRALSSIVKNDYGRSTPYQDVLWITFYRRDRGRKRDVQFFVRLSAGGVSYGLRLGREARAIGRQFRDRVHAHAKTLFDALRSGGAFDHCRFGDAEDLSDAITPTGPDDLRAWAAGKSLVAAKTVAAEDPLLTREELVGDILLTFDRLLAAYACAVADDPLPFLTRRAGSLSDRSSEFRRATFLSDGWLKRALDLLGLKRQLILQGVPGTGKTYVARQLARLLTGGREDAVRLVQFHPAYAYEEFVEGIRARTVEMNGRNEVTYPVEDGVLAAFAVEAERRPAEPFVLVIDEINRGNLPRIFGELLYLLEYRDQAVTLPYSRRPFRLPANLYLIGTMNAADRSVAHLDQALRRRFSFLEMPPDAAVLAAWLDAHPPRGGEEFAVSVLRLFEELNARLRADLGPDRQVGHSYFMVDLDADKLAAVWDHHIMPLLAEYFAAQPGRMAGYRLGELMHGRKAKRASSAASLSS